MRTTIFFAFSVAAALATGCGKNEMNTPDMATEMEPVKPAMNTTQIERMGRGTINVAVTNPFDLDYSAVQGGNGVNATRDMHSKDGNQAGWAAKWTPIIATTLGIYDGVDRVCGNQFGACSMAAGCASASTPMPGRYNTLAGVLADDQLYVDTTKSDCSFYLAVEAALLQVPGANMFCGGRTPLVDVVDVMYTAATVGAAGFPATPTAGFAIHDGVTKDNETTDSLTTFPFLSDPN